jgi:hypothetical protein
MQKAGTNLEYILKECEPKVFYTTRCNMWGVDLESDKLIIECKFLHLVTANIRRAT